MALQEPYLNAAFPIVDADGNMAKAFQDYMNVLAGNIPIVGTGSPEGVVEARQFSQYVDSTGSTGTILYIKKLTDIGGDRSMGWILV